MEQKVIALGFFDGVHLGHGQLLKRAREAADTLGVPAAALTFDSHPDTLVTGAAVPLLSQRADREAVMRRLYHMDQMLVLHFDTAMRDMPWEAFITEVLVNHYGACHLVCGHDFRFGKGGRGTASRLKEKCQELGLGCDVIPEYKLDGITVSSTYIRGLLEAGRMEEAVRFLGHPHILSGQVVNGAHIGRTMEIPTANLQVPAGVLVPARGVYACKVWVDGECHVAVTNVGVRPTVHGENLTIEPWLLDFTGDLYGKEIQVEFWKFLRPERLFPNLESLRAEIIRNAQEARNFFGAGGDDMER